MMFRGFVCGDCGTVAAITSISLSQDGSGAFLAGSTVELCVVDESFNINEQIKSSTGFFTVSSIPASNGDLVQIGNFKDARENAIANTISMQLNGDTSSSYNGQRMLGVDSSPSAATLSAGTSAGVGHCPSSASGSVAAEYGAYVAHFPNYAAGSNDRAVISLGGYHISYPYSLLSLYSNRWNNTAAINSIKLFHLVGAAGGIGFVAGSMLSTYVVPKNLIGRVELTADTRNVTFSSIPQTYDHLELTMYAKRDRASTSDSTFMYFNGDTTDANYDWQRLLANSGGVSASQNAASAYIGQNTASSSAANIFATLTVTMPNYTKTDRHKSRLISNGELKDGEAILFSQRWESTAAITTILMHGSGSTVKFTAGSVFELRGISAGTPPAAVSDIAALNDIAPADIEAIN